MMEHEKEQGRIKQNISRLIRTSRKKLNLTQKEAAHKIGASQSYLSKIEAERLIPDAAAWLQLCDIFNIPYSSANIGLIDSLTEIKVNNIENKSDRFSISENYRSCCGQSVRGLAPLINFINKRYGEEAFEKFLSKECDKFDRDYLFDLSHQVNIVFLSKLFNFAKCNTKDNKIFDDGLKDEYSNIINYGLTKKILGDNNKIMSGNEIILNYLDKSQFFENDFDYDIKSNNMDKTFLLDAFPKPHVNFLLEKTKDISPRSICDHKIVQLEGISRLSSGVKIIKHSCYFEGADKCSYEVT